MAWVDRLLTHGNLHYPSNKEGNFRITYYQIATLIEQRLRSL